MAILPITIHYYPIDSQHSTQGICNNRETRSQPRLRYQQLQTVLNLMTKFPWAMFSCHANFTLVIRVSLALVQSILRTICIQYCRHISTTGYPYHARYRGSSTQQNNRRLNNSWGAWVDIRSSFTKLQHGHCNWKPLHQLWLHWALLH